MKVTSKTIKQGLLILACSLASIYTAFPQTSVNRGIQIITATSSSAPGQSVFPYAQGGASVVFRTSQPIVNNITPIWSFDDPGSQQWNGSTDMMPVHVYRKVGRYFISCMLQNQVTGNIDTVIYDTVDVQGITPFIQSSQYNVLLLPEHKNQVYAKDTVDFVNASVAFSAPGIKLVWDFDDRFSAACTSFSVPVPGATLPFTHAKDQYNNSIHYYIYNGVTTPGKMNCRWSLDSLPRHKYTNWDSVYQWLIQGKTFPVSWNLPGIAANTPFTITAQTPVPDPFWLQQGKFVNLTSGTFRNRFDSITIIDSVLGVFKRYANAIVPNTNITFHQLVFRYLYTTSTKVRLTAVDAAHVPLAYDSVMMSLGKPLAYGLGIGGSIGRGRYNPASMYGKYVEFSFHKTDKAAGTLPYGQSDVLFNFDSLSDRLDLTPCELDGFVNYTGGQSPGGLEQPGFNTSYDWNPFSFWQTGAYPKMIYHYGPQTAHGPHRYIPADSNGIVTIGVLVANGVGSDKVWSDTVWYRQAVNVGREFDASFTTSFTNCEYRPVGTGVTVNSDVKFLRDIVADVWYWGDATYTIDSFWDAGYAVTNSFYTNGLRRVRYEFDETGLKDSLVNPMGFAPHTTGKFYQTSYTPVNLCGGNPVTSYIYNVDSAFLLGPLTHIYKKPSYEFASSIGRMIQTRQQQTTDLGPYFFIGKITAITYNKSRLNDTVFCAGEEVSFVDSVKYFRRDCAVTDLIFNPNRNEYGQILDAPYNSYHFDTANYWSRYSGKTTDIKRTYFNPQKGKTDTIYYEKLYWDFNGDGIIDANGTRPKYRFTTTGLQRVSMIIRDSLGYFDTAYTNVYISEYAADFTWEKQGCDRSVLFTDISTPRDHSFWKFSAAHTYLNVDTAKVLNTYPSTGSYRVTMISVSEIGCRDTVEKAIDIGGLMPRFTILSDTTGCPPFPVTIVLHPEDTVSSAITKIGWGDPANTYTVALHGFDTLGFVYDGPGIYTIRVMRNYSLTDTCPDAVWLRSITVHEKPLVSIQGEYNPVKGETYVYFSNSSKTLSYDWVAPSATILSKDSNAVVLRWDTIGSYPLTVIVNPGHAQCSNLDAIMVNVGSTGLLKNALARYVSIYPNPATSSITVTIDQGETWASGELIIYDVLGKVRHKQDLVSLSTSVHVSEWIRGVYFVSVRVGNKQLVRKFSVE